MISEIVGKIVGLILAHSVLIGSELQEGELLVPVVIYYQDGLRKIEAFEADTQNEAVLLGQQFLSSLPENVESWAYVQDGLITLENGQKQDIYFIKAWTSGMRMPLELYQMYQLHPFKLIDNIKVLNFEDSGLNPDDANLFTSALEEGIFSHPSATKEQLNQWF
ncbi:MAG: hypothetical protein ACRERX_21190 [Pseudomonas sp.]